MWEKPGDQGASVVHEFNVIEECMRWSREQDDVHRAVAQA
jgi:hypothetical protein